MSDVNLKRFVNININPHVTPKISSTRETIVLFTPDISDDNVGAQVLTFEDLSEVPYDSSTDTYKYLKVYFDNGGIKAEVHEGIAYDNLTVADLKALSNDLICIGCVVDDTHIENCYSQLKLLAQTLNSDSTVYGINEKFIVARTHADTPDTAKVKNFAVKYSSYTGAEMTIAAYVSQVNINEINSVNDYAFTEEDLGKDLNGQPLEEPGITDALYALIQAADMNVDVYLGNAVRNCGGNCKDGYDLINSFVRIILHQTLTAQLVLLLTQKIKSTDGISKIYAVIAQELEKYKTCGYLTTDKVWEDKTLTINYNQENYTIIEKGEALLNGYLIKILPYSSLTDVDKAAHSTPPIYVIIADQYGIRKITINGEII